jgi:hypothetical protein
MRIFKTVISVPLPVAAALVLLLIAAGVVMASESSPPLKVCVPAKASKPLVTPRTANPISCKTGYAIEELGRPAAVEGGVASATGFGSGEETTISAPSVTATSAIELTHEGGDDPVVGWYVKSRTPGVGFVVVGGGNVLIDWAVIN